MHNAYPWRLRRSQECIAAEPDLWFEGLGFPHPADACQPEPWRKPRRTQAASYRCGPRRHSLRCSWTVMTQDQKQGAERQMKVLSRLTAIAAAALFASAGSAFAGLGQPTPWELGLQDAASPVME